MYRGFVIFVLLMLTFCCPEKMNLIRLIESHQQEKQNVEARDVYKLIYQSVFGVAHILEFPDKAKVYLEQEFQSVASNNSEKLIENISISGDVVRLNLRPYKYHNGDIDLLFEAMVQSAEIIEGSDENFIAMWEKFKHAVAEGKLNFDRRQLKIFDEEVKQAGYPAVHHSQAYREANLPAYRVLKKNVAEELLKRQNISFD